ncbi:MAG: putative endonuclease [Clostridia bacterium]|nr:putative endonuclease [Clostridia bacterium]
MTNVKRRRGLIGEAAAANFLNSKGYRIIVRNFRCSLGEVDIIAQDGKEIVFIEVRTRSSTFYGTPQESVDVRKQYRLRLLANYYLCQNGLTEIPCRFDVVAVQLNREDKVTNIEVIKGAF